MENKNINIINTLKFQKLFILNIKLIRTPKLTGICLRPRKQLGARPQLLGNIDTRRAAFTLLAAVLTIGLTGTFSFSLATLSVSTSLVLTLLLNETDDACLCAFNVLGVPIDGRPFVDRPSPTPTPTLDSLFAVCGVAVPLLLIVVLPANDDRDRGADVDAESGGPIDPSMNFPFITEGGAVFVELFKPALARELLPSSVVAVFIFSTCAISFPISEKAEPGR